MRIKAIIPISPKNKLKLLLFLPIIVSAIVPAFSAFSIPAAPTDNGETVVPIDNGETTDPVDTGETAERARNCEARFIANSQVTDWVALGKVGGFLSFENKKRECLQRAKNYVSNLNFSNFGLTGQQVCDTGGIALGIDTQVDGKINSRDGEVTSYLQARCEQKCTSTYVP